MDNPCLRPACLSDITDVSFDDALRLPKELQVAYLFLKKIYDVEWRKRGFERSP